MWELSSHFPVVYFRSYYLEEQEAAVKDKSFSRHDEGRGWEKWLEVSVLLPELKAKPTPGMASNSLGVALNNSGFMPTNDSCKHSYHKGTSGEAKDQTLFVYLCEW